MSTLRSGPARERVDKGELEVSLARRTVVIDSRRTRPLYFDGRFLAADDLTREQNYFLTRQADLGRALGVGVVHGLMVSRGRTATSVRIQGGHGVTPTGEMVAVQETIEPNLADIGETQRLNLAFGLAGIPQAPARMRTGLFVIGLRPVEFTANPIASYPTEITGERSVEDGDIIEGVAVTLIPYPGVGARNELDALRARVAREVFLDQAKGGIPADVLPLGMLAADRGLVQWVDSWMVRREVGNDDGGLLGMGQGLRAQHEAYVLQYNRHLEDILEERSSGNLTGDFAASEYFSALPPVGTMPAATINPSDFTQRFFPPEVEVDLSVIPEDELSALIQESLTLPPIDLTLSEEQLESTTVLALVPVPREQVRSTLATLSSARRVLRVSAVGRVARIRPIEALRRLTLPRITAPVFSVVDLRDAEWARLLAGRRLLWYVRRRNLHYSADVVGVARQLGSDQPTAERELDTRLSERGLTDRVSTIRSRATEAGASEVVSFLSSDALRASPVLLEAAVGDLERAETLDRAAVLTVADRFNDPELGRGIAVLERANPGLTSDAELVSTLARSGLVPELDRLARETRTEDVATLASDISTAARQPTTEGLTTLLRERGGGTIR